MCGRVRAASNVSLTSLLQTSPLNSRYSLLSNSSNFNIHIQRLSSLITHHQHHFKRLISLVDNVNSNEKHNNNNNQNNNNNNNKQKFVACSVVGHRQISQPSFSQCFSSNSNYSACSDSLNKKKDFEILFSATGVNHAMHRCVNSGKTLKGILKGCAEQNALGVAAASGYQYASITDIYLYSSSSLNTSSSLLLCDDDQQKNGVNAVHCKKCISNETLLDEKVKLKSISCGNNNNNNNIVFPCPECWENISTVAEMRQDIGECEPLHLFVYTHSETGAVHGVSIAKQCLLISPSTCIDITIVFPG